MAAVLGCDEQGNLVRKAGIMGSFWLPAKSELAIRSVSIDNQRLEWPAD